MPTDRHSYHSTNRTSIPSVQNLQTSYHHSPAYITPSHRCSPIDNISPHQLQQSPHHYPSFYPQHLKTNDLHESIKNLKESMSIQEFMNKNVNDFVTSTGMNVSIYY